jgi:hypothetical protein
VGAGVVTRVVTGAADTGTVLGVTVDDDTALFISSAFDSIRPKEKVTNVLVPSTAVVLGRYRDTLTPVVLGARSACEFGAAVVAHSALLEVGFSLGVGHGIGGGEEGDGSDDGGESHGCGRWY